MYFNNLKSLLKDYPVSNINLIEKAYKFAKTAHQGQKRDSGEDYITHPVDVAKILISLEADQNTIIAAILHDVLEDTHIDYDIMTKEFGEDIADLVESVTKVTKLECEYSKLNIKIESLRKILNIGTLDQRTIIIKLADRLHNTRTLDGALPEKRLRIAEETMEVFVPLAMQFGIWSIKKELEELSFKILYPERYLELLKIIDKKRITKKKIINEVVEKLRANDSKGLIKNIVHIKHSFYSLHKRLLERQNTDLQFEDLLFFHVETTYEDDCYLALRLIHSLWKIKQGSEIDYISRPKDNGYRAYHTTIILGQGEMVRLAIMTVDLKERNWKGRIFEQHNNLKMDFLYPLKNIDDSTQRKPIEFLEATKSDLLTQRIEIIINGKSIYIPSSSTVLDAVFFYDFHKALRTSKILLNQKEALFDAGLKDGDMLKVVFSKEEKAKFDWFYLIKTASSRIIIQKYLQREGYAKKVYNGKVLIQKEFDLYEKGLFNEYLQKNRQIILKKFEATSLEEIYVSVADGSIKPYDILLICFPETKMVFYQHIFTKLETLFGRFTSGKKEEHIRLKIEGIIDDSSPESPINKIYNLRRSLGIKLFGSKLTEDADAKTFTQVIDCYASNKQAFNIFLGKLEQVSEIVSVKTLLSYQRQRLLLFWVFVILASWIGLPFMIDWGFKFQILNSDLLPKAIIYFSLVPVIIINYILYSFVRNYFSQIRNTIWPVTIGALLNLTGIGIFAWQTILHGFLINFYIIVSLIFIVNLFLLYKYLETKLSLLNEDKYLGDAKKNKLLGYVCAVSSTLIWGINPIMIRHVVSAGDNLLFTVGIRLIMGGVFLYIILILFQIFSNSSEYRKKINYSKYFWFMVFGLVGNFFLFHYGLQYTTASNANLIENFSPVLILIVVGLFWGNAGDLGRTKKDIIYTFCLVILGSIGASLVFSYLPKEVIKDYGTKFYGDFMEVLAMSFFALFIISSNRYMKQNNISSLLVTSRVLLIGALIFAPFVFLQTIPVLTLSQWGWLSTIGIVSTGLAYFLWNIASKHLSIIPAALILNINVLVTFTLESYLYNISLNVTFLLGAILMLTASFGAEIINSKWEKKIK